METPSGLTDFAKILGNRIRMRREELHMSQIDLGTLAQCSNKPAYQNMKAEPASFPARSSNALPRLLAGPWTAFAKASTTM